MLFNSTYRTQITIYNYKIITAKINVIWLRSTYYAVGMCDELMNNENNNSVLFYTTEI